MNRRHRICLCLVCCIVFFMYGVIRVEAARAGALGMGILCGMVCGRLDGRPPYLQTISGLLLWSMVIPH